MKKSWKEKRYERLLKIAKAKKDDARVTRSEIKDLERSLSLIKYGRGFEREVEILKLKEMGK